MSDPWIVPPSARLLSPNRYGADYRPGYVLPVEVLILHYTAGYSHTGSARWLASREAKASAHFVIGRGGELIQLVPLDERAWHAGGASSRWRGLTVNARSWSIELANRGWLRRTAAGRVVDSAGGRFSGPVHADAHGGLWEAFPAPQLETATALVAELIRRCPVLALEDHRPGELPRICGHRDVDPSRKVDPGPAFPLADVCAAARARA
jgi:N-acetylmuramoyl-L-alanine amidase